MKKTVAVILCTLILLLTTGYGCGRYAYITARGLEERLNEVIHAAMQRDYEAADRHMQAFREMWDRREKIMQLFFVHEDIDHVDERTDALKCALDERDKMHILLEASSLIHAVRHLYHRDAPDVTNIF